MKTTTSILSLVSFLAIGFAGVAHAGEGAARRGQVNVKAATTEAVVAGPAVIKVYSAFPGAKLFVADGDCTATAVQGTALPADRLETVTVRAGQIACVASTGERSIELLWKAQSGSPAPVAPTALVAKR
ncbi:MAG TPA: hypothetical protein VN903_09205 [Polyangia bacterium]|jgi:hypothetical protein|nr:hypothetical protein [Polyangia bacterium]